MVSLLSTIFTLIVHLHLIDNYHSVTRRIVGTETKVHSTETKVHCVDHPRKS